MTNIVSCHVRKSFLSIASLILTVSIIFWGNTKVTAYQNTKIRWELNWLNQKDEQLIKFIREHVLIPPPINQGNILLEKEYNENKPWEYQGLDGQGLIVEYLYGLRSERNRNKNGNIRQRFFVEAGAYDGEELSNTLYLEIRYNWTGLLVEPNPDYHTSLVGKRRNTWILPHCLSPKKYPVVVDFDATGYLGGIINNENSKNIVPADVIMGTSSHSSDPIWRRPLKIQCFPIYSVLRAIGTRTVDYFSLDIEGAEYQVLSTIPMQTSDIRLFGVEVEHIGKIFNGTEDEVTKLFKTNGYQYVAKSRFDKFYGKNKSMRRSKVKGILHVS